MRFATTGVKATVGGNLMGESALCAAYAIAKVPTFSPVSPTLIPIVPTSPPTSTPFDQSKQKFINKGGWVQL